MTTKKRSPFLRRALSETERADLLRIKSTHADWSSLIRRGDLTRLARHADVSRTIISRAVKHNRGSLRTMRLICNWLYTRQITEMNESKKNLITD